MALVPSCTHPDPIRGQKYLERSGSGFPDFLLSPFHLFRPALVQAAFAADSLSVKLKFKSADPRSACIRNFNLNFSLKLACDTP